MVVRDSIIYGISLNPDDKSNDAMVPVAGLQNGYDVDFDDNEQTIYWVEHPVSHCTETLCSFLVLFLVNKELEYGVETQFCWIVHVIRFPSKTHAEVHVSVCLPG